MASTTMDLSSIGARLAYARGRANLSAYALSRISGLAPSHVGLIEHGEIKGNLRAETARGLARTLGVSLEWLLFGAGPMPKDRAIRRAVDEARRLFDEKEARKKNGEAA